MAKLEHRLPTSRFSHRGIFSGHKSSDRNTTVGYRPTHTAMEVLTSDGGGVCGPSSSNANQLPNELSMVREWKSANFSPSASSCLRSSETSQRSRSVALS